MLNIDPKIALLISTLAAILAIVGHFLGFFKWLSRLARKASHSITRHRPRVPRETIRVVVSHPRENWWGMGSQNKQPAMQVHGHLHVTNITEEPAHLLTTRIIRPRKARTDGMLLVRHPEQDIYGSYAIVPKGTTDVSLDFWIQPPILEEGQQKLQKLWGHNTYPTTIILAGRGSHIFICHLRSCEGASSHLSMGVLFRVEIGSSGRTPLGN